jgi:hypothetical protein
MVCFAAPHRSCSQGFVALLGEVVDIQGILQGKNERVATQHVRLDGVAVALAIVPVIQRVRWLYITEVAVVPACTCAPPTLGRLPLAPMMQTMILWHARMYSCMYVCAPYRRPWRAAGHHAWHWPSNRARPTRWSRARARAHTHTHTHTHTHIHTPQTTNNAQHMHTTTDTHIHARASGGNRFLP